MDRKPRIFLILMLTLLYEEASSATISTVSTVSKAEGREPELSPQTEAGVASEDVTILHVGDKTLLEDAGGQEGSEQLEVRKLSNLRETVSIALSRRGDSKSYNPKNNKGGKRAGILPASPISSTAVDGDDDDDFSDEDYDSELDSPRPSFRPGGPFPHAGTPGPRGGLPGPRGGPAIPQGGPLRRAGSFPAGGPRLPSTPLERSFSNPPLGSRAPGMGAFQVGNPNNGQRGFGRGQGKYASPEWEPEPVGPGLAADARFIRMHNAPGDVTPLRIWRDVMKDRMNTVMDVSGNVEHGENFDAKVDSFFNGPR